MARTTCRKRGPIHQPSLSENLVAAAAAGSARLPRHTTSLPSRAHYTSPRCSGKVTMSRPRTWLHLLLQRRFPLHMQVATMSRLSCARHSHHNPNTNLRPQQLRASGPRLSEYARLLSPPVHPRRIVLLRAAAPCARPARRPVRLQARARRSPARRVLNHGLTKEEGWAR